MNNKLITEYRRLIDDFTALVDAVFQGDISVCDFSLQPGRVSDEVLPPLCLHATLSFTYAAFQQDRIVNGACMVAKRVDEIFPEKTLSYLLSILNSWLETTGLDGELLFFTGNIKTLMKPDVPPLVNSWTLMHFQLDAKES
jgi:hypothetical protein